jgi:hypothetical protein
MAKHKHYEAIVGWADGKQIQYKSELGHWIDTDCPYWEEEDEYRVKPEPKPDVKQYRIASMNGELNMDNSDFNLVLTFDGETGKLKSAEVLNQD